MALEFITPNPLRRENFASTQSKTAVTAGKEEVDSRKGKQFSKDASLAVTNYAKAEINFGKNLIQDSFDAQKTGSVLDGDEDILGQIESYVNKTLGWVRVDKMYKNGNEVIHIIYTNGSEDIDSNGNIYVIEKENFGVKQKADVKAHTSKSVDEEQKAAEEDDVNADEELGEDDDEYEDEDEYEDDEEPEWA